MIPGKNTKEMSNAEKKLFTKMKRNVNAVSGKNRRKKSLFYKFTDHKNRTKEKLGLNANNAKELNNTGTKYNIRIIFMLLYLKTVTLSILCNEMQHLKT